MDKRWIYAGVGAFVFLVLVCSTKKVVLKEVSSEDSSKSFDANNLPPALKPPKRLFEGEEIPPMPKRDYSFNGMGLKPRFDR
jgi:hypothetical protein